MELYKPYQIKITTSRSKSEVIMSLSKEASFAEDEFEIASNVFSFRRGSTVVGKVSTIENQTVVEASILPSVELKVFPFLFLLLALIVFFVEVFSLLKQHKFTLKTLFFFPGVLFISVLIYGITRINFWLSYQAQEALLKHLVQKG